MCLLLVPILLTGCWERSSLAWSREFQDIESAFAKADSPDQFSEVALRYQQLINDGLTSGAVFYNQGNAWMRAGERGRAIASYRQAQQYRPRDPFLAANLETALSTTGNAGAIQRPGGLIGAVFFWQNWLSYPEKFVVTTALLAAALTCMILISVFPHRYGLRRWTALMSVLWLTSAASTAWDWHRFDRTTHGVIVTTDVIARKGNSEAYEPAFDRNLTEGTEFVVLAQRSDWLQIEINDASVAWIPQTSAVLFPAHRAQSGE